MVKALLIADGLYLAILIIVCLIVGDRKSKKTLFQEMEESGEWRLWVILLVGPILNIIILIALMIDLFYSGDYEIKYTLSSEEEE